MSDKPILFSGPMILALLAGRKTQTRRIFKQIEPMPNGAWHIFGGMIGVAEGDVSKHAPDYVRIQPGDRLWVKETWRTESRAYDDLAPSQMGGEETILYDADANWGLNKTVGKTRVSIHMVRWASRLTLLVTDVRVERLQDITHADAIAEGIEPYGGIDPDCSGWRDYSDPSLRHWVPPYTSYATLWEKINGPTSWTDNPFVAAYSFEVIKQNIDQIGSAA